MDPMEQAEEEMRRREEENQKDLEDTIGLDDFISRRDLANRGKDVRPSGKNIIDLQLAASSISIRSSSNRRKTVGDSVGGSDFDDLSDFDLLSKNRILLFDGAVNKREADGILWRVTRRRLFLFNDILLITTKKENRAVNINGEAYELNQLLWIKDICINNLSHDEDEDPSAFQVVICSGRKMQPVSSVIFTCDSEAEKKNWIYELSNTMFAYHLKSSFSRKLGWFHMLMQGSLHSSALLGDVLVLRKHLKMLERQGVGVDITDESGMCPIHWAVIGGNEACVRIILEKGADVNCLNGGLNTPLLLAAAKGFETICRMLLDKGADPSMRNLRDRDAVFMAVVYGHSSKGLPWTLQMLNSRGIDLNQVDSIGATPLHVCAERNLARPVKMLVDAGAAVNVKHRQNGLTPLQLACQHEHPDVETIRSFLDKGAYCNWRDSQGRTAFEIVLQKHNSPRARLQPDGKIYIPEDQTISVISATNMERPDTDSVSSSSRSERESKWRDMDSTLEKVGDFVVHALPVLLEIAKKGGRFDVKDLDTLRPSFRSAVLEARTVWEQKKEPPNFIEFVLAREQAGEELRVDKTLWTKNDSSQICELCSMQFTLKVRKHHCRACGALSCEFCSSKRLQLTVIEDGQKDGQQSRGDDSSERQERVCDGCFNRLCLEASQPSMDHFRVRQLKACALELMDSLGELIEALDDPNGDPQGINAALRNSMIAMGVDSSGEQYGTPSRTISQRMQSPRQNSISHGNSSTSSTLYYTPPKPKQGQPNNATDNNTPDRSIESRVALARVGEALIDAIRVREEKLTKTDNITGKFLEASDGYHRIAKKLIEQKMASNRLWGMR